MAVNFEAINHTPLSLVVRGSGVNATLASGDRMSFSVDKDCIVQAFDGDRIVGAFKVMRKFPLWAIYDDENLPMTTITSAHRDKTVDHLQIGPNMQPELYRYALDLGVREHPVMRELREETVASPDLNALMLTSPDEAKFLGLVIKLMNAKRGIEVGVFTGYSSLSFALNLPEDGKLVALDVSDEWTSIGRKYWKKAGVQDRIDLRIAPGLESLENMIAAGEAGSYDFAFIDADKPNYLNYFERLIKLVRIGGLILVDNVLWHGNVINDQDHSESTIAIRKFNDAIHARDDVDFVLLPFADGITFARRTK